MNTAATSISIRAIQEADVERIRAREQFDAGKKVYRLQRRDDGSIYVEEGLAWSRNKRTFVAWAGTAFAGRLQSFRTGKQVLASEPAGALTRYAQQLVGMTEAASQKLKALEAEKAMVAEAMKTTGSSGPVTMDALLLGDEENTMGDSKYADAAAEEAEQTAAEQAAATAVTELGALLKNEPADDAHLDEPGILAAGGGAKYMADADAPKQVSLPGLRIRLVDLNAKVVDAWEKAFAAHPEVERSCDSMLSQKVDVWVTPTNSKGNMSGGLDAAIAGYCPGIQDAVHEAIKGLGGKLAVGRATVVKNPASQGPKYVVSTPTMEGESDDLRRTKNTALACAAAWQAIYVAAERMKAEGVGIDGITVAIPGLGAGTGKMPADKCAALMLVGFRVFRRGHFPSFEAMLTAVNEELVNADLVAAAEAQPTAA